MRKKIRVALYLCMQKGEAFVDVFDFMYSHAAIIGFAQFLTRYYLKQFQQLDSVSQIGEEIFNFHFCLRLILKWVNTVELYSWINLFGDHLVLVNKNTIDESFYAFQGISLEPGRSYPFKITSFVAQE